MRCFNPYKNSNIFITRKNDKYFHYCKLVVKSLYANAGDTRDMGSIPGWGRCHGVGNGNPLQYSCLGNPMDRGAWWTVVHGVAKSQT